MLKGPLCTYDLYQCKSCGAAVDIHEPDGDWEWDQEAGVAHLREPEETPYRSGGAHEDYMAAWRQKVELNR